MPKKGSKSKGAPSYDDVVVLEALDECQRSYGCHRRHMVVLEELLQAFPNELTMTLVQVVDRILVCGRREPAVERLARFMPDFCHYAVEQGAKRAAANKKKDEGANKKKATRRGAIGDSESESEEEEEEEIESTSALQLTYFLMEYVLRHHAAADKAVRFRVCQLLGGLLVALGEEGDISEELWENLHEAMLERIDDKVPAVRAEAVRALSRTQDPSDKDDPITAAYFTLLESDPSKDVRRAVIMSIGPTKRALPAIIARCRDVKRDVRRAVYLVIKEKYKFKQIPLASMLTLLSTGLQSRHLMVEKACVAMLGKWAADCKGNVMQVIDALDVQKNTHVAELACKALIRTVPAVLAPPKNFATGQGDALAGAAITAEQALYWRMYCCNQNLHRPRIPADEWDALVPSGTVVAKYIKESAEAESWFVCGQFLAFATEMDLDDEVGRRNLATVLQELCPAADVQVIPMLMHALGRVHAANEGDFVRLCLQIVSDMLDDENEEEEEEEEEEDEDLQIRARSLIQHMLCELNKWQPMLTTAMEEHIVPVLTEYYGAGTASTTSKTPMALVAPALASVALVAALSPSQAMPHAPLLITALQHDKNADIRMVAAQALFDIALMAHPQDECMAAQILPALSDLLHSRTTALKTAAIEGFAKLLFSDKMPPPPNANRNTPKDDEDEDEDDDDEEENAVPPNRHDTLLSLVLTYFAPDTKTNAKKLEMDQALCSDEQYVRQCLSVFFPSYAFASGMHQEYVQELVIPLIKRLTEASPKSTVGKMDLGTLVEFMLFLTDPHHRRARGPTAFGGRVSHATIGADMLNKIVMECPQAPYVKIIAKALGSLNLDDCDKDDMLHLHDMLSQTVDQNLISDKTASKQVAKYAENVTTVLQDRQWIVAAN